MTDKSLVVIVPAAVRDEAVLFAAAIGYRIAFVFALTADGTGATHYALHAGAGPVMRLVLASEGSADPAILAEAGAAFGALAAAGYTAADVAAFRAALVTSVRGPGEAFGIDHLLEVAAAQGLALFSG